MNKNQEPQTKSGKKIAIKPDGPYVVKGNIPLVRKTQVVSEYGEPLTWRKDETLETSEPYTLCRCGYTHKKPFCDGAHRNKNFNGTETADIGTTKERRITYPDGKNIIVKFDATLCMDSGFCGTRKTNVQQLMRNTDDTGVRTQVIGMIERCPSGALTYSIEQGAADIEPDLPEQVAVTTEITSVGPIEGPIWVTGRIPIERADGKSLELRNRVTLCNCGLSKTKPLCDGTHRTKDSIPMYDPRNNK